MIKFLALGFALAGAEPSNITPHSTFRALKAASPGLLKRLVGRSWQSLCLRVVHREPSLRQHANKHVPNVFSPCLLDVSVTPLRTQVTVSERPEVTLNICWLDGNDRSLDTDVLVRRCLRLYTYTEPAGTPEELSFPRSPGCYDS